MDIDSSVKLMFPTGFPDEWIDNPDCSNYLSKLRQYDLSKISKELDHLSIEKSTVLNLTQDLAFSNYKTFIQTAECSRELFKEFQKTEASLDALLEKVPKFTSECEEFMKKCGEIKSERNVNSVSLSKHGSILQLLEIPQLMDTAVREGLYDEALRLASFVRRMAKTHQNIPVVQNLLTEIETCWINLMKRLIWELHTELQLPRCLQVVGVLRRMNVLTELELRLKFLQARDSWFLSILKQIPKNENQHLIKIVDAYRTQMFNIITQYSAVFPEKDILLTVDQQNFNDYPILHEWINNKVCDFITILDREIASCDDPIGCMEQVMYFGQSLGRVGADLRALVAPIFVKNLVQKLTLNVKEASKQFVTDMDKFSLGTMNTMQTFQQPENDASPPLVITSYYPLGKYVNSLISCFNQLRSCAPLYLAEPFTRLLEQSLASVATTIAQFYRREQQAMSPEERDLLTKMVVCFNDCLVPYIQRCLHLLFSPVEIASFLCVPVYKLQEQHLTFFNNEKISTPINHLLPVMRLDISSVVGESEIKPKEETDTKPEELN